MIEVYYFTDAIHIQFKAHLNIGLFCMDSGGYMMMCFAITAKPFHHIQIIILINILMDSVLMSSNIILDHIDVLYGILEVGEYEFAHQVTCSVYAVLCVVYGVGVWQFLVFFYEIPDFNCFGYYLFF